MEIDFTRPHRICEDMGHEYVWYDETDEKFWLDTGETFVEGARPCRQCDQMRTPEGHDPCIANLPGVNFACCGHGVRDGYVSFTNGIAIYGEFKEVIEFGTGFEVRRRR